MFWLILFALGIGSASLLPSAALALSSKTRRYALLPLCVILPLAGWFMGILLGAPAPEGDKAAGPWIGLIVILMSMLAIPAVTVAVGILLACRTDTRTHAAHMFGLVASFVGAALIGFLVVRLIPEWSKSQPTGAILWRAPL